jgi:hypothetical protein
LFHLGKVPILRPQTFSLKNAVLDICHEMLHEEKIPENVDCRLSLGHGDDVTFPWSSQLQDIQWNQDGVVDMVTGDRSRITRVLRLLVETSLLRTKAGSVKLGVTYWPGMQAKKANFAFTVSDTGPALNVAWVQERFHSYFTTSESEKAAPATEDLRLGENSGGEGGCDLGLFVSFNLVQTLGGCLECFSHDDEKGCTFTFTIPLDGSEQGAQTAFNDLSLVDTLQELDVLGAWTDVCDSALAIEHVQRDSLDPTPQAAELPAGVCRASQHLYYTQYSETEDIGHCDLLHTLDQLASRMK